MMIPRLALFVLAASLVLCVCLVARRRNEGLGLPLIALMSFGFLYLIQPLFLASQNQLDLFLNDRQVSSALLWPAAALPAFLFGWMRRPTPATHSSLPWDPKRLWSFGLFTAAAGLALYGLFILRSGGFGDMFARQHGLAAAWDENTAYIYLSPWWTLAGIAMMFLAAPRIPARPLRWIVPSVLTVVMALNAVLLSSRSYVFATAVAAGAAIAIGQGWTVSLRRAAPTALAIGVAVLAVLGFRSILHLGDAGPDLPDLADALTAAVSVDSPSALRRITGNEFIVHAATLDTVEATGKYDYAINWAFVYLVHPIPRILWPEKPYRFESPGIGPADVYAHTGVVIAGGAAPGIVADLFSNFGPALLIFLFLFGAWSSRLYSRALTLDSPLATLAYIMLLAQSLNCFAQGFSAILIPLPYALAPMLLFTLSQRAFAHPSAQPCRP